MDTTKPPDPREDQHKDPHVTTTGHEAHESAPAALQWRLTRRCALTPHQLLLSWRAVLVISCLTALLFAARGVWMVPLWCLLQLVLISSMYFVYMLHATDGEQITLASDGSLLIDVVRGMHTRCYRLNPVWSRLERSGPFRDQLWLCCRRNRIEVATQLPPRDKYRVERELRQMLARTQSGWPPLE